MGASFPCCGIIFSHLARQHFGEGRYRIVNQLGKGAYGKILVCTAKGLAKERAAKMLDTVQIPIVSIEQEARILQKLDHPNIVKCHEVIHEAKSVYIVMDRFEIDLLRSMIGYVNTKGILPFNVSSMITYQMALAVDYLHSCSIVHRDVKGDNFLCERGDLTDAQNRIVLTDFGAAVELRSPDLRLHEPCGTIRYWAPEFYQLDYHMKVDIWALGVILYNLLTGRFPFRNKTQVTTKDPAFCADVPQPLQDLAFACLEKSEEKRISAQNLLRCEGLKIEQSYSDPPQARPAMVKYNTSELHLDQVGTCSSSVPKLGQACITAEKKPAWTLEEAYSILEEYSTEAGKDVLSSMGMSRQSSGYSE